MKKVQQLREKYEANKEIIDLDTLKNIAEILFKLADDYEKVLHGLQSDEAKFVEGVGITTVAGRDTSMEYHTPDGSTGDLSVSMAINQLDVDPTNIN